LTSLPHVLHFVSSVILAPFGSELRITWSQSTMSCPALQRTRFPLAADLSRWVEKFLKSVKIKIKTKFIEERDGNNFKRAGTQTTIRRNNF